MEESQRAESLIQYLNEFERESLPTLLTTPQQKQRLDNDERISEDDYIFHSMTPESSVDEVEAIKSDISKEDNIAVFTNDYHVPRYEKLLSSVHDSAEDSSNYLVFGSEFEQDESRYGNKWRSEAFRTLLPQTLKDVGKKYLR